MAKKLQLSNKNIILGVTGGIAAYKSCDIVRLLVAEGAQVHVVMTKGAEQFVTPMTFQTLSKNQVNTDIFSLTQESKMGHITLADKTDLVLVAPATANTIAKAACGICDDLLSTILCATKAPIAMAPAMNVHMYENKIVQENISRLKKHGVRMIGPAKGPLACGYEGLGRMAEPEHIVGEVKKILFSKKLGVSSLVARR